MLRHLLMQIENIMKSTITTQLEGGWGGRTGSCQRQRTSAPFRCDPIPFDLGRPDMSKFVFQQIENLSNDYDETAAGQNDESHLFLTLSSLLWVHIICMEKERMRETAIK